MAGHLRAQCQAGRRLHFLARLNQVAAVLCSERCDASSDLYCNSRAETWKKNDVGGREANLHRNALDNFDEVFRGVVRRQERKASLGSSRDGVHCAFEPAWPEGVHRDSDRLSGSQLLDSESP